MGDLFEAELEGCPQPAPAPAPAACGPRCPSAPDLSARALVISASIPLKTGPRLTKIKIVIKLITEDDYENVEDVQ